MTIFAREIVAKEGSKIKVITPGWIQNFPDTPGNNYDVNGKDGVKGNDGKDGPNGRKTILISRKKKVSISFKNRMWCCITAWGSRTQNVLSFIY